MRPHWPFSSAQKIGLLVKKKKKKKKISALAFPNTRSIVGTQESGQVINTHTHTYAHKITACEGFCSFIWDLFARLYLYLCCSLIWSCGGSRNISNYLVNVSPSTQGKHSCAMCVCVCVCVLGGGGGTLLPTVLLPLPCIHTFLWAFPI